MNNTRRMWVVRWTGHDGAPGRRSFGNEQRARTHAANIAGAGMPAVVTLEPVTVNHPAALSRVFSVRAPRRAGA